MIELHELPQGRTCVSSTVAMYLSQCTVEETQVRPFEPGQTGGSGFFAHSSSFPFALFAQNLQALIAPCLPNGMKLS
jgi:hypothetical protein